MLAKIFRPHVQALLSPLFAFALCLGVSEVSAQFRAAPGREYREFHNPVNPVRGEAVIGVALVPTEVEQAGKSVAVQIPQPFTGEIRLETATADGRFRGEGTFIGSSNGNEWITLELAAPSKPDGGSQLVRPVGAATLALSARGASGELFVSRWGTEAPKSAQEKVRLYVNSRRADMFLRAGSTVVPCKSNGVSQPVRFDTYCDVLLADIPKDGRLTLIRREGFDEQSQSIKLFWR